MKAERWPVVAGAKLWPAPRLRLGKWHRSRSVGCEQSLRGGRHRVEIEPGTCSWTELAKSSEPGADIHLERKALSTLARGSNWGVESRFRSGNGNKRDRAEPGLGVPAALFRIRFVRVYPTYRNNVMTCPRDIQPDDKNCAEDGRNELPTTPSLRPSSGSRPCARLGGRVTMAACSTGVAAAMALQPAWKSRSQYQPISVFS